MGRFREQKASMYHAAAAAADATQQLLRPLANNWLSQ